MYALAMATVTFVSGLAVGAISEPLSSFIPNRDIVMAASRRVAVIGVVVAPMILILSLVFKSPEIAAAGILAPLIALFNHYQYSAIALRGGIAPILLELPRTLVAILAVISSVILPLNAAVYFIAWIGAISLTSLAVLIHSRVRKSDTALPEFSSTPFTLEFLLGTGSVQLMTFLIGGFAGTEVNGAIRGGGTVYGPISLLVSAVQMLFIPFLASSGSARYAHAIRLSVLGGLAAGAGVLLLLAVPDELGVVLLGETWAVARPLLPMMGVDVIAATAYGPLVAGLKSVRDGTRLLRTRAILSPVRVVAVVVCAIHWGAFGAVTALAAAAVLSLLLWNFELRNSLKNFEETTL